MIKRWKDKLNDRGSAMLVAIIVSMVVIAFCLSLLLVSYSVFMAAIHKSTQTQCRELAKSISQEIGQEITTPMFIDPDEEQAAVDDPNKYVLWSYLKKNLNNEKWPYYGGPEVSFHTENYAYRYFDMEISGGDPDKYAPVSGDKTICMYWTPDDINAPEDLSNAMLTVVVTCTRGDQVCSVTSHYRVLVADNGCWKIIADEG